ncbi:MAG: trigger factor, partial [Oscillospiraceae bacterium]|nr:trigger factor [Oscillospiraceae bacterium]
TGMDISDFRESNRDRAVSEVKLRLALESIADQEKLDVTEEEVNESLKGLAEANNMTVDEVKRRIPMLDYLMDMRVGKAIDLVKENAEIVEAAAEEAPAEETPAEA